MQHTILNTQYVRDAEQGRRAGTQGRRVAGTTDLIHFTGSFQWTKNGVKTRH